MNAWLRGHIIDRMKDRYGFFVDPNDLLNAVESGKALFVVSGATGSGRLIYAVPIERESALVWVNVLYAPPTAERPGAIISVLPRELLKEQEYLEAKAKVDGRRERMDRYARQVRQYERACRTQKSQAKRFFRDIKQSEDIDEFGDL